jgi:ankyrin repeat protein
VHHVNLRPEGGSALHEAVAHKAEAVVELLLRHGANPFVENTKVRRCCQRRAD